MNCNAANRANQRTRTLFISVDVSPNNPEVVCGSHPVQRVHETVRRRQDGSVVDETPAADVASAKDCLIAGATPNGHLEMEVTHGSTFLSALDCIYGIVSMALNKQDNELVERLMTSP